MGRFHGEGYWWSPGRIGFNIDLDYRASWSILRCMCVDTRGEWRGGQFFPLVFSPELFLLVPFCGSNSPWSILWPVLLQHLGLRPASTLDNVAVFMLGLDCWCMCSVSGLPGSRVFPFFIPVLALSHWDPKFCATSLILTMANPVTETSIFPSLRGQVVASWIQVPWVNVCIRWLERSGI